MKARTPEAPRERTAASRHGLLPERRCRRCSLCAPSGKCLDTAIKSGRCGDWVWYVRNSKQQKRLWRKPKDSRTPKQLHWRTLLATASRKYSQSLTDEQQDACIAAGAKAQSRARLGQSGPLTGQQHWVRQQCLQPKAKAGRQTEKVAKAPQTQEILRSTWDPRRGLAGVKPAHPRQMAASKCGHSRTSSIASPRKSQRLSGKTGRFLAVGHGAQSARAGGRHRQGRRRELWRGG